MNNLKIVIEEFYSQQEAEKGVNETLKELAAGGENVNDVETHIVNDQGELKYIFVYKIKE